MPCESDSDDDAVFVDQPLSTSSAGASIVKQGLFDVLPPAVAARMRSRQMPRQYDTTQRRERVTQKRAIDENVCSAENRRKRGPLC
eukprot:SAG31_NODE_1046_length_10177_cov_13.677218_10_plen_86_part_00